MTFSLMQVNLSSELHNTFIFTGHLNSLKFVGLPGRRKCRQKKRWKDNISEWTGLGLGEALRKAEDRGEWRKVVA